MLKYSPRRQRKLKPNAIPTLDIMCNTSSVCEIGIKDEDIVNKQLEITGFINTE